MCDHGRSTYRDYNRPGRAEQPMVRVGERLAIADWDVALRTAASLLRGKRARVVVSPALSNEALHLLGKLVQRTGGEGRFRVRTGPEAPLPGVEDLALRADRAPNVTGAELMGFARSESLLAGLGADEVLVLADVDVEALDADALRAARTLIVIGTTLPDAFAHAAVVLPVTTFAEEEGTFTNLRGRVQRYLQARAAPGQARPSYFVLSDLLALLGETTGHYIAADAFAALAAERAAFAGLSYDGLGLRGAIAPGAATAGAAR
jgi:predicted molibdopterin-dependent oxidoreductase YjgC